MGVGWGGLLPLQEVIWASFFGRRYLGSVRSTAMPFTFGMSALGPVLVAYYYDIAGDYNMALVSRLKKFENKEDLNFICQTILC